MSTITKSVIILILIIIMIIIIITMIITIIIMIIIIMRKSNFSNIKWSLAVFLRLIFKVPESIIYIVL